MKKLITTLLMVSLMASLAVTASAAGPMSYRIDGTGDPDYGTPTSIDVVHTVHPIRIHNAKRQNSRIK